MANGILEVADSAQKAQKEKGILASYWQVSSSLSDPYPVIMHNCFHTLVLFRLIEGNIPTRNMLTRKAELVTTKT